MPSRNCVALPRGWSKHVKSGLLHAISLASMALTVARSRHNRSRLQTELERADTEIGLLKEELEIKDARWGRVPPRRRPRFAPVQRMRILQVKAARAGLHLGVTTVGRMLRDTEPLPDETATLDVVETRAVTAKRPGDVWHVDFTTVPTGTGFWVPWVPFALPQSWPFCWRVAVVVDHFSRVVVGFAVFHQCPTSGDIQRFLDRAIRCTTGSPKYVITDKGRQFWCDSFKQWCRRRAIRPRFGAVGKQGSIATVERFIRSMKNECTRRIRVPLRIEVMRSELGFYSTRYNEHRPSQALGGRTPKEVHSGIRSANTRPRLEPRRDCPATGPCASPQTPIRGKRGTKLSLVVRYVEGGRHLPVVELRKTA